MNLKIGVIIRKLRIENNVTQDALATVIGVTPQAVSRWEAEKRKRTLSFGWTA